MVRQCGEKGLLILAVAMGGSQALISVRDCGNVIQSKNLDSPVLEFFLPVECANYGWLCKLRNEPGGKFLINLNLLLNPRFYDVQVHLEIVVVE